MGLLDPTTHLQKTTRSGFFGGTIVVAHCGKEWRAEDVSPGPMKPGWVSSCSKCAKRAGHKW